MICRNRAPGAPSIAWWSQVSDKVMKSPDILPLVLAQISLGRAGAPREIGTVAAFFASDEASYLTGQSIHVDGGWEGK